MVSKLSPIAGPIYFGYNRSMIDTPFVSSVAAMIGDPTRALMLCALKEDSNLSSTELAYTAGVAPSTASDHLAKLLKAGLVSCSASGRHRYYRLARAEVADALESLEALSVAIAPPDRLKPPIDPSFRFARTCYDHLAGSLGVGITWAMVEQKYLRVADSGFSPTERGEKWLTALGIDFAGLQAKPRQLTRNCRDWSESRVHLGGPLGAAMFSCFSGYKWIRRNKKSRVVRLTSLGREEIRRRFGINT